VESLDVAFAEWKLVPFAVKNSILNVLLTDVPALLARLEQAEALLRSAEARLADVEADPRLRLPFLLEAREQNDIGWEPAEAHLDEADAEAHRSGYECPTRVRTLRAARAKREGGA